MTGASPSPSPNPAGPEMFRAEHVSAEAHLHWRDGAKWTVLEEMQLAKGRKRDLSYAEIAKMLGRRERAVRVHACKIGIAKRNDRTRALNARRRRQSQASKG